MNERQTIIDLISFDDNQQQANDEIVETNATEEQEQLQEENVSEENNQEIEENIEKQDSEQESNDDVKDDEENEENIDNNENNNVEENTEEYSFEDYLNKLHQEGLLNIPEDDEINSIDDLIKYQKEAINTAIESQIQELVDKIGRDGAELIRFLKQGGTVDEFLELRKQLSSNDIPKLSVDDEKTHEQVIRYYLKNIKGLEDKTIDLAIKSAKDDGKLYELAIEYNNKLIDIKQKEAKRKQQEIEERRKQAELARKKFEESIVNTLEKMNLPEQEKEELSRYINVRDVKVGDGQYITKFQRDIQEKLSDPKNLIILARLVRNNFDITQELNKEKSKIVNNIKKKLVMKKDTKPLRLIDII